jgi:hypothetical protein
MPRVTPATLALLVPVLVKLIAHLVTTTGYGLSGDELYLIACSEHPDAGYVDIGPVPVLLMYVQRLIGGDALFAIRFLSAIAGAATVYLTGLIARRMGAGPFGQFLAALCALIAPAFLITNHVATPLAFSLLTWTAASYLIVLIVDESTPVRWLLLGGIFGLGFLSSFLTALLMVSVAGGIVLTDQRRHLRTPWPWAGAGVTLIVLLPWCVWQASHGWPTVEWLRNVHAETTVARPFSLIFSDHIKLLHPLSLVIWADGLFALILHPQIRRYRVLAWMYVLALLVMFAAGMESYLLIIAAAPLFAAGASFLDGVLKWRWAQAVLAVLLVAGGILTAPMGLPVLTPRNYIEYEKMSGLRMSMGHEECTDRLPGYYGTMFGRKELAVVLNAVFITLPPRERAHFGILCEEATQAAALNFYGGSYGLPRAISGHNQFWEWGTGGYSGDRLVVVGGNAAALQKLFAEVELRMRFRDEYLHPGNGMTPIFNVRLSAAPLGMLWPGLKSYR